MHGEETMTREAGATGYIGCSICGVR